MGQNYQPPQQSGQSPPYQPPPYQPQYPPQYPPPPPPNIKRRRPFWQWVVGVLALIFGCGIVATLAAPPKPATPAAISTSAVLAASATPFVAQIAPTVAPATLAPATVMPTSPPALVATSAPTPQPPPTLAPPEPTGTAVAAAPQTSLTVTHSPGTVSDNSIATVSIKTTPGAACSIRVVYASGSKSTASGLDPRTADASGGVTWMWKIGAKTGSGDALAQITCGDASVTVTFTVK